MGAWTFVVRAILAIQEFCRWEKFSLRQPLPWVKPGERVPEGQVVTKYRLRTNKLSEMRWVYLVQTDEGVYGSILEPHVTGLFDLFLTPLVEVGKTSLYSSNNLSNLLREGRQVHGCAVT
jgi:hypothetical protein